MYLFSASDPLILMVMDLKWPAAGARELETAHRAIDVLARHLAIVRFSVAAGKDRFNEQIKLGGPGGLEISMPNLTGIRVSPSSGPSMSNSSLSQMWGATKVQPRNGKIGSCAGVAI